MKMVRFSAVVMSLIIAVTVFSVTSSAQTTVTADSVNLSLTAEEKTRLPFYSEFSKDFPNELGQDEITISSDKAVFSATPEFKKNPENDSSVIKWSENNEKITWNFEIKSAGLYEISVKYMNLNNIGSNSVRSLLIDGTQPFFEAANIEFYSKWVDKGEVTVNSIGDEVRPDIEHLNEWQTFTLCDSTGSYDEPFAFYFTEGSHTLTLEYVSNDMLIDTVSITSKTEVKSYSEVSSNYKNKKNDNLLVFQAEDQIAYKNDSTLSITCGTDAEMQPRSDGYRVYNMVGNDVWSKGGQAITFKFNVKQDGLYRIALRYRQKWNDGLASYRKIAIDGKVPFDELSSYCFPYSNHWETEILGNGKEDYLFELSAGEHYITMSVVQGEYTEIVHKLYDITTDLSNMMLDITMLTGSDPDPNYDYQFFKFIPTLESDFNTLIKNVSDCEKALSAITDKTTSISSSLESIVTQFKSMLDDPFTIAKRYSQISNAQTTLGSWYSTLQELPLALDEFVVAGQNAEVEVRKSNIFQNIISALKGFLITFSRDYNSVGSILDGDVEVKDTIEVWLGQGTEWAEILQEMTDKSFTRNTGIQVDLSVVPSGQLGTGSANVLLLSIISGSAPDVVLSSEISAPVEFAIRDASVDLTRFEDFKDVQKQFLDTAFIPLSYQDGIYALPETMNFTALFYREDILERYGIKLPETWDELCNDTLQVLAQNGMEFYLPQNLNYFIFQNGGTYYTEDGFKSALDTPKAFDSFRQYTEMFTHYGCPVTASFFNRFRSGEMPIGIGDYSVYLQLKTAAPELADKWSIAPMIGTKTENGEINISAGGTLSKCALMLSKDSEEKYDSCWEYLKWWSSAETQTNYSRDVEALLGTESRWCSANLEAFLSLDWGRQERKVFEEQWKWVEETPVVLGSAYAGRYLVNAFTDVVVTGTSSPRDALENAVIQINKELKYKQEEYGVFADE